MSIDATVRSYMRYKIGDLDQMLADHPEFNEAEARQAWERISTRDDATDATTGHGPKLTNVSDAMMGLQMDIDSLIELSTNPDETRRIVHDLIDAAAFEAIIHLYTAEEVARALNLNPMYVRRLAREHGCGWLYGDKWLYTNADIEALRNRGDGRRKQDGSP